MKRNNRFIAIWLPLLLAIVLVAGIVIGTRLNSATSDQPLFIYPKSGKLQNVLNYIVREYVDTIQREELVEAAIPAMLEKLDPHSIYIPARDLQAVNEPLEGNFEGIGVQFNMPNDTIVIIATIQGGPSEKVGIQAGDRIITIEDSLVAGNQVPQDNIVKLLKGPRNTTVKVGIERKGVDGLIDFEIKRDKIPLYSVDVSYMINETTGYIKISKFARTTFHEFVQGLEKLKKQGLEKLIVDLRGNNGGYLDAATTISDQFLDKGQLIVYTEGRARPRTDLVANAEGSYLEGELVILIDEWSASASEILAGAIQDNDRGTIIGRRSFGKGLVQEPIMLSDGSALRLTIARYYTPTGRSIQKSYENGTTDYYNDISQRYASGEFLESDSINFSDSLKYYTPSGKIVYGGGGIMPDIFIPMDTSHVTRYFMNIRNRGLIYRYAFEYTDRERERLNQFTNYKELDNYLTGENLLNRFVSYAEKNGVSRNSGEIKESEILILTQLKAYIARNILDNEGFYPIFHRIDNTLQETIKYLDNN
jgi:carboxyl-terminal processing protease